MTLERRVFELEKAIKELNKHALMDNKELTVKVPYFTFGDAQVPTRKKDGDCGYDAYALGTVTIPAHSGAKVPLGIGVIIPEPFGIKAETRSGNFLKGINVGSAWVDRGYRGQINALIQNITDKDIVIEKGDRPCSIELELTFKAEFVDAKEFYGDKFDEIMNTERGATGFGSSGN